MTDPSPETLAYLSAMKSHEEDRQRAITQAREYYAGRHPVYLTDRMREFIGIGHMTQDNPFKLNLVKIIINALVERLKPTGFDSDEDEQAQADGSTLKPLAAWAWDLWQAERMDARAMDVHRMAVRDGEAFVIVAPDEDEQRAAFYPHPAYVSPECGGDGFGVKLFYTDDDYDNGAVEYAVKHWTERRKVGEGARLRFVNVPRMTVYWPDRIERYEKPSGEWVPYTADGKKFPQPWVDANDEPLGVPVIAFRNADCRDEAADAIGINDAANKALVDLVAAADLNAFPLLVVLGFHPTRDGAAPAEDSSNMLFTGPGAMIGTTKKPGDADAKFLPGSELTNLIDYVGALVQWAAMTTDTPLSRFLTTRQVAAEGTLKQQEGPLVSKVEARQVVFGDAWEDALTMAARIENLYFKTGLPIEEVTLSTQWAPAATRDEKAELESAQIKAQALGVPVAKLWAELGYSQTEIAAMQTMKAESDAEALQRQQQLMAAQTPAPQPPRATVRNVERDGQGRMLRVVERQVSDG